jgi:hypothetical protein
MSLVAAAVAHELGTHIDDLVDEGVTALETADGIPVGELADTQTSGNDLSFVIVTADGRKVKVTCEEIQ